MGALNIVLALLAIIRFASSDVSVLLGGENDDLFGSTLDTVETYSPQCGLFTSGLPPLPTARKKHGATYLDGKLYICGGYNIILEVKECYSLDLTTQPLEWVEIAPMNHGRFDFDLVTAGGLLYAVGGEGPFSQHDDIEVYDPSANEWSIFTKLTGFRLSSCALPSPSQDAIYITGGYDQDGGRTRLEKLNLTDSSWSRLADMSENRTSHACALRGSHGFVVAGGWGESEGPNVGQITPVDNVDYYDIEKDEWIPMSHMAHRRTEFGITSEKNMGQMTAFGGYQGGHLKSYEIFTPSTNNSLEGSWEYAHDYLSEPKSDMAVVQVPSEIIPEDCKKFHKM